MIKCTDCKKELAPIEVIDDHDDNLCIKCARVRYPNEEAFQENN